ncbi:MAG: complex I NDUFA9 subunit family protein [Tistlia sp.]|uniref:complex I NDUFA9 subunit family protein n=1 Tax=Tistlia sp. TaxID=3057121 RepID=UPI0034A27024
MTEPLVTVFGGTGFLGRRVVARLLRADAGVRVASRHPGKARALFGTPPRLEAVAADIASEAQVATAVAGASGVVNAVSLYVEGGGATFHAIHVEAARRLARAAREAGVGRLAQLSGIGADPRSESPYIRSRGEGEAAVRAAFPEATVLRSAVMAGRDDSLVVPLAGLLRRFPAFALFGGGQTRLQPAWVEDVAEAVARSVAGQEPPPAGLLELGGAEVLSYRALIEAICRRIGRRPLLLPLPFAAWQRLAWLAERLPEPPITRNQVELMRFDNVVSGALPGFADLGLAPRGLSSLLPEILDGAG